MTSETKKQIEEILRSCVLRALDRIKKDKTYKPFHESLLTKELVNASSFERSFSTSFGQGPVEEISALIALNAGYQVQRQKETQVNLFKGAIDEIERICSALRAGEKKPNWEQEVKKVQAYQKGDTEVRRVISDLWMKKDGKEKYISIKTVKPNLDQTEIAKKDLLLLKAHDPSFETYFGLFYNPGGEERKDYNWTMPFKIFDMHNDPIVLIGKDYWNMIGESQNTYSELLKIFVKVGKQTQSEIAKL
ncbi:MAG: TdeIII family type II restriction endonuclease [Crocinitomicaceae bacterium]|nr:TdeIII family type II restriction endonuclease [Crocinitomicaceae bacterium]